MAMVGPSWLPLDNWLLKLNTLDPPPPRPNESSRPALALGFPSNIQDMHRKTKLLASCIHHAKNRRLGDPNPIRKYEWIWDVCHKIKPNMGLKQFMKSRKILKTYSNISDFPTTWIKRYWAMILGLGMICGCFLPIATTESYMSKITI